MGKRAGGLVVKGWHNTSIFTTLSSTESTREMFRKEVEIIVKLGLLEEENDSEWGAPSFAQVKAKNDSGKIIKWLSGIKQAIET